MKILCKWFLRERACRPWWINLLFLFCIFMTFVYCPWDLFIKPTFNDEEVWFGVMFYGSTAKILAVPHWIIYVMGYLGFKRMSTWMWPWSAVYVLQIAVSFLVWPILYKSGSDRFVYALLGGGFFLCLSFFLWKSRKLFQGKSMSTRQRYGDWVLVTGASSGIGKCFSTELAKRGHNVVLVARRKKRLEELSANLQKQFSIETRVISADLTRDDEVQKLIATVNDIQISVLVNNAGVGYEGLVENQDSERLEDLVRLKCLAPVSLTGRLLPSMRNLDRGAIIFVGSVAGSQPLPNHAVYASSKSFNNLFGEALWAELRDTGVDVLSVLPGTTETEFAKTANQISRSGSSPDKVVEEALEVLGLQPALTVGWFNWIRSNVGYRFLSRTLLVLVAEYIMKRRSNQDN